MLRSILIDDEPQNAVILKKDLEMHCPEVCNCCLPIANGTKRMSKEGVN